VRWQDAEAAYEENEAQAREMTRAASALALEASALPWYRGAKAQRLYRQAFALQLGAVRLAEENVILMLTAGPE
jgi:hypothetical protein